MCYPTLNHMTVLYFLLSMHIVIDTVIKAIIAYIREWLQLHGTHIEIEHVI